MGSKKSSSKHDPANRTVAPAANAPSLDLSKLSSQMKNLTMKSTTSHSKAPEPNKPPKIPKSSNKSVKNLDASAKPSPIACGSRMPPKVPVSSKQSAKGLDSIMPIHKVLSMIKDSSSPSSSHKSSECVRPHSPSSRNKSIPASKTSKGVLSEL